MALSDAGGPGYHWIAACFAGAAPPDLPPEPTDAEQSDDHQQYVQNLMVSRHLYAFVLLTSLNIFKLLQDSSGIFRVYWIWSISGDSPEIPII